MNTLDPLSQLLTSKKLIILDGGMGTELELRGEDVNDPLWSAKILLEKPQSIYDIHYDYFKSGADISITASYQASVIGLIAYSSVPTEEEARDIIKKSAKVAIEARDNFWKSLGNESDRPRGLVAGSAGPYGAYLANGSEYKGDYDPNLTVEYLSEFHYGRLIALLDAGCDLIAFETIPNKKEIQAIMEVFNDLCSHRVLENKRKVSAFIALSIQDSGHLADGTPFEEVCDLINKNKQNFVALGINCCPLRITTDALCALKHYTDLPLVAYPNSGEAYDGINKVWYGVEDHQTLHVEASNWMKNGARIIGDCCRTNPNDIADLYRTHKV